MSVYVATIYGDRAEILCDAGAWDAAGNLRAAPGKVRACASYPAAVLTRGSTVWGQAYREGLTKAIDRDGFDDTMATLSAELAAGKLGAAADVASEVVIVGISETTGPVIRWFRTFDAEGIEARVLHESRGTVFCGGELPILHDRVQRAGTLRDAVGFMEMVRAERLPLPGAGPERAGHYVGARLDWTVVDADGVRTETIHEFGDALGKPISLTSNVVAFPGMNRQQRRAAERAARRA